MAEYIDTSAAAKLIVAEAETEALRVHLQGGPGPPFTSDLTRAELIRTVRRADPRLATAARSVLEAFIIVTMPTSTFERAALLDPPTLRSLDALHLAAALSVGDELDAVITYDARLAQAAEAAGIRTVAPGAT